VRQGTGFPTAACADELATSPPLRAATTGFTYSPVIGVIEHEQDASHEPGMWSAARDLAEEETLERDDRVEGGSTVIKSMRHRETIENGAGSGAK